MLQLLHFHDKTSLVRVFHAGIYENGVYSRIFAVFFLVLLFYLAADYENVILVLYLCLDTYLTAGILT